MKTIYTDGYLIGSNPSNKGGYVLTDKIGKPFYEGYFEKDFISSNEMELQGLVKACEVAEIGDEIITDSQVAKCWVKRGSCKARPDLNDLAYRGKTYVYMKDLKITQVPRELNEAGIYLENKNL